MTQFVYFRDFWPAQYGGGGLTFAVHWAATDNNTGSATWSLSLERPITNGIDPSNWGTAQTGAVAGPGATGDIAVATVTVTDGQLPASLAAGDLWRCRVSRVIGGYTGSPQLLGVEVTET